ncbi:MAG: D-aminoacyl-tRNA deacylase [Treponema sp.]
MRAVIQRVVSGSVSIQGLDTQSIGKGFVILLGICPEDTEDDIEWLVKKIVQLRIFEDEQGKMNRCILDVQGDILLVSQFTLFASTKKGNRPSFNAAAEPAIAVPLYECCIKKMSAALGKAVKTGQFGADMQVEIHNDGPVTILIDTKVKE